MSVGTTGMRLRGKRMILTTENPFAFTGGVVEKTGPDHYVVYDGTITTCELPRPKWEFNAHKIVVEVGGNATIYHSTFRIEGVPVFYFPFATHPVEREPRQTGFLIPNIGSSSIKGTILGDSIFWAINRSMDLTAGAEYFTRRGWAPQIEFRARPSEKSYVYLNYFGVFDRGIGTASPVDQGGHEVHLDARRYFCPQLSRRRQHRLSELFRFPPRLQRRLQPGGELGGEVGGLSLQRHARVFLQRVRRSAIRTLKARLRATSSPFCMLPAWSLPAWTTRSGTRLFTGLMMPRLKDCRAANLRFEPRRWSDASICVRHCLFPWCCMDGRCVRSFRCARLSTPSNWCPAAAGWEWRRATSSTARRSRDRWKFVRPPLERVYDREFWGRKWKHVIEPRATYRYVTGVDNFAQHSAL